MHVSLWLLPPPTLLTSDTWDPSASIPLPSGPWPHPLQPPSNPHPSRHHLLHSLRHRQKFPGLLLSVFRMKFNVGDAKHPNEVKSIFAFCLICETEEKADRDFHVCRRKSLSDLCMYQAPKMILLGSDIFHRSIAWEALGVVNNVSSISSKLPYALE